jgi:sarcosine oxidase subunit beta
LAAASPLQGSTANTCAVIRVHYSTLEGTAVAYESYQYWNDWANYLRVEDPNGFAKFIQQGVLVFKSQANDYLKKVKSKLDELGIGYENWDFKKIKQKFPILDDTSYYPPRRPDDSEFGMPNETPTLREATSRIPYFRCTMCRLQQRLMERNFNSTARLSIS